MHKEIFVNVLLKTQKGLSFNGSFVIDKTDLELVKKLNPPLRLILKENETISHFCHFNDFVITVRNKDKNLINALKKNHLESSGYNLISILSEENNSPLWREGIFNKSHERMAILAG